MRTFELTVREGEYHSPTRWRWTLNRAGGPFVEDHDVDLPADRYLAGFRDLPQFLRDGFDWQRPLVRERELLDGLGRWIGERVLGRIGRRLVEEAPCVVVVRPPAGAGELLQRPLESAIVDDKPLVTQDVTFVHVPPGTQSQAKDARDPTIRVLAVFSLPADEPVSLMLRDQRLRLTALVNRVSRVEGRALELTVLQWAATPDALRDVLEDGRGWDVVHFSGHGLADGLVLETPTGTTEPVTTADLTPLLRTARERLKLVVLSSCHSAGVVKTTAALLPAAGPEPEPDAGALVNLAESTVRQTGAAVLAMRYSVADDFSIELMEQLYTSMFHSRQALARALQLALRAVLPPTPTVGVPPLSVATPALFGELAADLSLAPPKRGWTPVQLDLRLAAFPPEPPYLVGRSSEMSSATSVIEPGSGHAGLLLVGPPGIGTSACAVELAYRTALRMEGFRPVYHRVEAPGGSVAGTLERFLRDLHRQLDQGRPASAPRDLDDHLPVLTELFERGAVLLVVDDIDVLLTDQAPHTWRDPGWGVVVAALFGHRGWSRTILTGTRRPQPLPPGVVVVEPAPLSVLESALLARRLPLLGRHLSGRAGLPAAQSLDLVARLLTAAAGVPGRILEADRNPVPDGPADERYLKVLGSLMGELLR